jgi:hypothetical protein
MLKLCSKDFLAGRWLWLPTLALFLVFAAQAVSFRSGLLLLLGPALVPVWLAISDIIDDKNGAARLYASLPLTRRTIVRGRYLLAGGLALAAAAATFGMIGLALLLPGLGMPDALWPGLLSLQGVAGFLIASLLLAALYLPVSFALGPGRTAVVFPAVLAATAAALWALERLAAALFGFAPVVFTADLWRDPAAKAARLFSAARAGGTAVPALAVLLAAAIVAGSEALAGRLYDRREL